MEWVVRTVAVGVPLGFPAAQVEEVAAMEEMTVVAATAGAKMAAVQAVGLLVALTAPMAVQGGGAEAAHLELLDKAAERLAGGVAKKAGAGQEEVVKSVEAWREN